MKSKVMLSVLMLTCMALNVNLAWGTEEILSQTLEYDTWIYSGSTTYKSSYRLFHSEVWFQQAGTPEYIGRFPFDDNPFISAKISKNIPFDYLTIYYLTIYKIVIFSLPKTKLVFDC